MVKVACDNEALDRSTDALGAELVVALLDVAWETDEET